MYIDYINCIQNEYIDDFINYLKQLITPRRFERFENVLNRRLEHLVVVFENVYQEHNASAIIRTCDGFGIQYIYVIENKNRFKPNEGISLGAEKWVDIIHYQGDNAVKKLYDNLRAQGRIIIATALSENAKNVREIIINKPVAVVFGTEKEGLTKEAINLADICVYIPMEGFVDSFNVSVSAAIILEILTQKLEKAGFKRGLPNNEKKRLLIEWILKTVNDPNKVIQNYLKSKNL